MRKIRFIVMHSKIPDQWIAVGFEKFFAAQSATLRDLWYSVHMSMFGHEVVRIELTKELGKGRVASTIGRGPKDIRAKMRTAVQLDTSRLKVPKLRAELHGKALKVPPLPKVELWLANEALDDRPQLRQR